MLLDSQTTIRIQENCRIRGISIETEFCMKIVRGTSNILSQLPYPVITIGNFDGVHKGHQALLQKTCEIAHNNNGTAIAFTFEPHPLKIIAPEKFPLQLTTFQKKMELFEACGLDQVICADFNAGFASQSPREFAQNVLVDKIGAREVVVGFDYAFGRGREGTLEYLKQMGDELNFVVHAIEPVKIKGQMISSSTVRAMLEAGRVETAKDFLGRNYSLRGEVVHGHHRGQSIGFPTANINPGEALVPATGVYTVYALINGERKPAVANVGIKPTFNSNELSVEVHIFEFEGDLYGQEIEVEFISRLRDEFKFSSADALVEQIRKDIQNAKQLLGGVR